MKSKIVTSIIITSLLGLSSIAISQPNRFGSFEPDKNLNLTDKQANTLVNALLIRLGNDDETIMKTENIELDNGKKFYIVFLSKQNNAKPSRFVVIDAQNGRPMPFPFNPDKARQIMEYRAQNN